MEELDLKELIQIFWEKRIQILLITAIFIVLGIIYTVGFVKPKYQSKTSLLLATNSSSQSNANGITTNDLTLNSKLVSTYSDMVSGNKIIREVIKNLGMNLQEDDVKKSISVKARDNADMIDIIVNIAINFFSKTYTTRRFHRMRTIMQYIFHRARVWVG